jgi:hypothetical protein
MRVTRREPTKSRFFCRFGTEPLVQLAFMIDDADLAARGGVSVEGMACMPPKFRATGVAFSPQETNKDYSAWSGNWTIGYIYYRAPEGDRNEPITWIYSIHQVKHDFGRSMTRTSKNSLAARS